MKSETLRLVFALIEANFHNAQKIKWMILPSEKLTAESLQQAYESGWKTALSTLRQQMEDEKPKGKT